MPRISTLKPQLDSLTVTAMTRPLHICYGMRGWLVGWREIGEYCGFGGAKGTSATRTGKRLEGLYKMPIHRLPDRKPRAIPFELDAWLIEFSRMWQNGRPESPDSQSTKLGRDWRTSRRNSKGESPSGIKIEGD